MRFDLNPFSIFDEIHIPYKRCVSSAEFSSIRAGGIIDACVYPRNISELIYIVEALQKSGTRYVLLGNCTNTLFSDSGFSGVAVILRLLSGFSAERGGVDVLCGTTLAYAIRKLSSSGIELSSALSGIPGTLGAMVRGNCGCFGECISDIFISCLVYDTKSNRTFNLTRDEMAFEYRTSTVAKENLIVLKARLRTNVRSQSEIENSIFEYARKRRESQPVEPSLGSFFKRPSSHSLTASQLIDQSGLKGYSVGGAEVSTKHAGFIVNKGCATATEIITLAEHVKDRVFDKFSVLLEEEAVII